MPQHESKSERRGVSSLSAPFGYFVPLALSESPSGPVTLKAFSIRTSKPIRRRKGLWLLQHQTLNFEKWRGPPVGKIWCSRRGCLVRRSRFGWVDAPRGSRFLCEQRNSENCGVHPDPRVRRSRTMATV